MTDTSADALDGSGIAGELAAYQAAVREVIPQWSEFCELGRGQVAARAPAAISWREVGASRVAPMADDWWGAAADRGAERPNAVEWGTRAEVPAERPAGGVLVSGASPDVGASAVGAQVESGSVSEEPWPGLMGRSLTEPGQGGRSTKTRRFEPTWNGIAGSGGADGDADVAGSPGRWGLVAAAGGGRAGAEVASDGEVARVAQTAPVTADVDGRTQRFDAGADARGSGWTVGGWGTPPGATMAAGPAETEAGFERNDEGRSQDEGELYLEGDRIGRWVMTLLGDRASGPSGGFTGVDPRLGPAYPGALSGE